MNKLRLAFSKKQWMISLLVVFSFILGFIWIRMNFAGKHRIISQIKVEIQNELKPFQFTNTQIVLERIQNAIGNPIGRPASEISLTQLEENLKKFPETGKIIIYISFDGTLNVKIIERLAVALLINENGRSCYLDTSLVMINIPTKGSAPVLVINGNIDQAIQAGKKINKKWQAQLGPLLRFLKHNELWYQHFEQCNVDKFEQLILFPNVGTHSIVLNNVLNLDQKFENLRLFYDKGLKNLGWDQYKSIDISYKNQIVTKRHVSNSEHN
jgi:cell division protein FtsQ